MQGLLARLKTAARDQNADGGGPQQPERVVKTPDTKGNLMLNNFMRPKDVSNQLEKKEGLQNGESVESVVDISDSRCTSRAEDAIDIVVAMNKTSKSRKSSTNSTKQSKKLIKSRGSRGSRVSLSSVGLSDKDDLDVSGLDSDDDVMLSQRSSVLTSRQAWAAFEESVKNIDCKIEYFTKKPKPNFVSSGDFQKVMVDMYGNSEYGNTKGYTLLKKKLNGMARASTLATRVFSVAAAKGQEERLQEATKEELESEVNGESDDVDAEAEDMNHVIAKRGWKMLKRQVNENVMEQKTQSTKLNWTMLQHTLKQMTNVERTRQDLYERYGIVPTVKEDGSTICENQMLSERARAQLHSKDRGKENRRPYSYQPPPVHLRSQSQSGSSKDYIHKGAKLPSVQNKKRPVTAKSSYM